MAKQITRVRRTFTPQFQKDAVALVREGHSLTAVAYDLGIARSLLQHWQQQLDSPEEYETQYAAG
jgi:transposase-like protein